MLNGQVSGNLTWTVCASKKLFKNQLLERYPFSGRCDSAGELLHTPYADSNFCGHGPDVYTTRNTLSRLSEGWSRYALALLILRTSGWIPHRQNCLPVMAHYEPLILKRAVTFVEIFFILSKVAVRIDLKFERRPRSLKIRPTDTSSHCFTRFFFFYATR